MKGIAVSKGVAVGKAYLLDHSKLSILKQILEEHEVENEIERFRNAIAKTKLQMADIKNRAEKIADKCVVTSDNPRSEDPKLIIADILTGLSRMQNVTVEEDREKAIDLAVLEASHNDVIVVAGKGHETYQLVKDKVLDFDDRQKVRESLKKRQSNGSQE